MPTQRVVVKMIRLGFDRGGSELGVLEVVSMTFSRECSCCSDSISTVLGLAIHVGDVEGSRLGRCLSLASGGTTHFVCSLKLSDSRSAGHRSRTSRSVLQSCQWRSISFWSYPAL